MFLIETRARRRRLSEQHFLTIPLRAERLPHRRKHLSICRILTAAIALALIVGDSVNGTAHIEDGDGEERYIRILPEEFACRMADVGKPRKGDAVARLNRNRNVHDLTPREFASKRARRSIGDCRNIGTRGCHTLALWNLGIKPYAKRERVLADMGKRPPQSLLRFFPKPMHARELIRDRRHGIHADGRGHKKWRPVENAFHEFAAGCGRFCNYFHKIPQTFGYDDASENMARTRVSVSTVAAP